MPGDESPKKPEQKKPEIPASVTFMEMMRQAAARAAKNAPPPEPSWTDPVIPPNIKRRYRDRAAEPPPPKAEAVPTAEVPAPAPVEAAPAVSIPVADEIPAAPPAPVIDPPMQSIADSAPAEPDYNRAMEAQRVQRIKRRKTQRRRQTVGVLGGIFRTVIVCLTAAGLMATIFTWWTPSGFMKAEVREELSIAIATSSVTLAPTLMPTPNWVRRVGIVSGHRGPENDPGAVCPDGLTEAEINFNVAQLVVRNLRSRGYTVDLLDEFDPRLNNYQAEALVSIHSNTCQEWPGGEVVSGYLIAAAAARVTARGNDDVLVNCVARHYETVTGLQRRPGVTVDMTDYHSFREIHPLTPAAIIELGFMLADREIMTEKPDVLAHGITDGILCFLEPGSIELTPTAEAGV